MEVLLSVSGGNEVDEMASLWSWLRTQRELMGAVRGVREGPGETDLGGAVDVLVMTLGTGGAGAVLAQSLTAWLRTRKPTVSITVKTKSGTTTINASNIDADDVMPLLDRTLNANDEREN
jgi:xanthine dehydrogenase iron-sulfur cluster and FAD-binding subunit A